MEQRIKDRYSNLILQEAMWRHRIARDQFQSLDAVENFVYEFERGDHSYILRIGHSLRRSEAMIQGEVDWINYLAAGGVSVAQAIRSKTGNLVEVIDMVEIFTYAVIHRDCDLSNITDRWCARFMVDRKYMIEHDVPCIDFDFESLSTDV